MNKALFAPTLTLLLAACGGGGGGGGALPVTAFTSFANIPTPGTLQLSGNTLESSYTSNTNTFAVTSVGAVQAGTGTITNTYDSAGILTNKRVTGQLSSAGGPPTTQSGGIEGIGTSNAQSFAITSGATSAFNYQSFGIWQTGRTTGSGNVGAISAGAATPDASIPSSGTATFNGGSVGLAVDSAGSNYAVTAQSALNANFGTRTVGLSTYSSNKIDMNTAVVSSASDLNISGTLTYAPATNAFSGSVSTAGGQTGTANGRFYGPGASEAGGTFSTKGTALQNYAGAYGAKR